MERHQRLPAAGPQREALRQKGQFWTPDWVARAMVAYVLQGDVDRLFDPSVGAGVFFRVAKELGQLEGKSIALSGTEIDSEALAQALQAGLTPDDLLHVQRRDFVLQPPDGPLQAIVCNPPYIRHHRLSTEVKAKLQAFGKQMTGNVLDGRAGLHVYFLLRTLQLLAPDGRLAFIVPADTCEGKFAPMLWSWITSHYQLEAVVTFAPEATPFPGVDTNAVVLLIKNATPQVNMLWAQCRIANTNQLSRWTGSSFKEQPTNDLRVQRRTLAEALNTGLSRPPNNVASIHTEREVTLSDFATVVRGIATGDNDFFFLTGEQAHTLKLPENVLQRAIGRTRDVITEEITQETLCRLEAKGRPTWLLSLSGQPVDTLSQPIQKYLTYGEELGLPRRPLISTRKPWYKMEKRQPPPFLFAYLGRRNARFFLNTACVVPLSCFLCVYPHQHDARFIAQLWHVLQHPATVANLALVGKSYGAGAIKVEPRALERLPIPQEALKASGMSLPQRFTQAALFSASIG